MRTDRVGSFLEFYKQEDADLVVKELNGKDLLGHRVTLQGYVSNLSLCTDGR